MIAFRAGQRRLHHQRRHDVRRDRQHADVPGRVAERARGLDPAIPPPPCAGAGSWRVRCCEGGLMAFRQRDCRDAGQLPPRSPVGGVGGG
jgi:hypothetical protein